MDLEKLCKDAAQISLEVGKFLNKEAQGFDLSKIEHKGINDLVSYVDREAEKQLVSKLSKLIPDAGFYTEEDDANKKITDKTYHWIIDPLDGTTNFMHGLPIYSISIGLMQEDELILGVVYEINRDECFYAWKEGGAFCNKQAIQVSPINSLSESLLATGFPYSNFEHFNAYLDIIKEFMQKTHGLRRMGSAAVDLAYVAMGRFQGFFEYNLNAWDIAGGAMLIKEAGGNLSTFTGGDDYLFGREIIAAGSIYNDMKQIIETNWVQGYDI